MEIKIAIYITLNDARETFKKQYVSPLNRSNNELAYTFKYVQCKHIISVIDRTED